jgi:hypothetical protein
MTTLEAMKAIVKRLRESKEIEKKVFTPGDLRILIEENFEGQVANAHFPPNEEVALKDALERGMRASVTATSLSGSTYEIDFIGTTQIKRSPTGPIKVRQAECIYTKKNGDKKFAIKYVGLSMGVRPRIVFYDDLSDVLADEDIEHTTYSESSGILSPEIKLVIDWNN